MELINLTGHIVCLCGHKQLILQAAPKERVLRIEYEERERDGIVYRYPVPNYIPEKRDGAIYVVSRQTAEAMALFGRDDFVYPARMKHIVRDMPVKIGGKQAFDKDGIPLYREEHIVVCAEQLAGIRRKDDKNRDED